jgi:hypothetical protein
MTGIILTKETTLTRVKAPSLPIATADYQQKYVDDLNNILRLYFTQIDNFINQLTLGGVYVVAKLPSAADVEVGARAFVTDSSVSTFGSTVTGGGSTKVPVYSDGTNWKVG